MTFQRYMESSNVFVEDKDRAYHALRLVSDTATLIEKVKYFRNESSLIVSDLGDVFFRLFAMLGKFELAFDQEPFDLEAMKAKTDTIDTLYPISDDSLLQNYMLEIGVISNIITENQKYGVERFTDEDLDRIKKSIYSYVLQLLILVCKLNLSIDRILDFSLNKLKAESKKLNVKVIKEEEPKPAPQPITEEVEEAEE